MENVYTNEKYNPENQPKAWLFLLPSLGVILLFNIYPLIRSFWMSFQKGSLLKLQFTGLSNYQKVLADPVFHKALLNTALYAFCSSTNCFYVFQLSLLGLSLKR